MFDTQALKESFGRAAPAYDVQAHLQRRVRRHCIAAAKRCWPAGARILDLGCGTGMLWQEAAQLKLRWRITGLDLSFGMCTEMREKGGRVINADAAALPFADASFDGIFSSLMLQWMNDLPAACREMSRILKPNGLAVVATFVQGTLHELQSAFSILDNTPHVSHFPPAHEVLKHTHEAGFVMAAAEQAMLVEHYPDAIALMRSLQAVGATHKETGRRRGLMTLSQLAGVEQAYEKRFSDADGLRATWQLLYLVLQKI